MKKSLRIGTGGSKQACWQAEYTRAELAKIGIDSELIIIKTQGDLSQKNTSDKIDGKFFSTKEIEDALLRGEIDLTPLPFSELPTLQPEGLVLTAVSARANPADWLVLRKESVAPGLDFDAKNGASVGTFSALQQMQLGHFRPDLSITELLENLPTALGNLKRGKYDGIVLSAADIAPCGLQLIDYQIVELSPMEFVPAPAQGVFAWQTNADDRETRLILKNLHHPEVAAMTNIERNILKILERSGQTPVGAFCKKDAAGNFHVTAATMADGEWRQIRLSSSTSFGLAERAVKLLLRDR